MVSLGLETPTLGKFTARMAQAPATVGEEWRKGIRTLAPLASEAVRVKVRERTKRRTGRLEASIQSQITSGPSGLFTELHVTSTAPHAVYIERGTRSHLIRARRRGGKLRFPGTGGQFVFRESVNHPGTDAYWVFRDGLRDFRPVATRTMAGHLGQVTRRLGRA